MHLQASLLCEVKLAAKQSPFTVTESTRGAAYLKRVVLEALVGTGVLVAVGSDVAVGVVVALGVGVGGVEASSCITITARTTIAAVIAPNSAIRPTVRLIGGTL